MKRCGAVEVRAAGPTKTTGAYRWLAAVVIGDLVATTVHLAMLRYVIPTPVLARTRGRPVATVSLASRRTQRLWLLYLSWYYCVFQPRRHGEVRNGGGIRACSSPRRVR
jgi:hypothetical protein